MAEEMGGTCACGGSCGCGGHDQPAQEIYLTREEYVARLEQYLVELKAEMESVQSELTQLRQTA